MQYEKIRIPFEEKLGNELFETLEGDILMDIIAEGKIDGMSYDYHQMLQHSFKASSGLAPGLFGVFQEVKKTPGFEETIDSYIKNSPEFNAFVTESVQQSFNPYLFGNGKG